MDTGQGPGAAMPQGCPVQAGSAEQWPNSFSISHPFGPPNHVLVVKSKAFRSETLPCSCSS